MLSAYGNSNKNYRNKINNNNNGNNSSSGGGNSDCGDSSVNSVLDRFITACVSKQDRQSRNDRMKRNTTVRREKNRGKSSKVEWTPLYWHHGPACVVVCANVCKRDQVSSRVKTHRVKTHQLKWIHAFARAKWWERERQNITCIHLYNVLRSQPMRYTVSVWVAFLTHKHNETNNKWLIYRCMQQR